MGALLNRILFNKVYVWSLSSRKIILSPFFICRLYIDANMLCTFKHFSKKICAKMEKGGGGASQSSDDDGNIKFRWIKSSDPYNCEQIYRRKSCPCYYWRKKILKENHWRTKPATNIATEPVCLQRLIYICIYINIYISNISVYIF